MSRFAWGNSPELWAERGELVEEVGVPVGNEVQLHRSDVRTINHLNYIAKLEEIRDNHTVIGDPRTEDTGHPITAEISVANADALKDGKGVVLQVSTSGSTLVENPSNGVELADNALLNPDYAFIYMASLGNGGTSGLKGEELEDAKETGRLVHLSLRDGSSFYVPTTIQGIARALGTVAEVTHISSDDTGAHIAPAILAAMPKDQAKAAFLYNPKNLRDLSTLKYTAGMLKAMTLENYAYSLASDDALRVDSERRGEAKKIFGDDFKKRVERKRASAGTYNPGKMKDETDIFRRGRGTGNAAVKHALAALVQHEDLKLTYGFPTHSVNYPGPKGVNNFLSDIYDAHIVDTGERIQTLEVPLGQYGHGYYPLVRLAMQSYAFTR